MFLESITGIVVVIVLFNAIELARSFADNPREPRRLRPLIPLVGHILGLLRYGPTYYTYTSARSNDGMYMLDLLGVKMYVVNDPRLLPMITKAHKVISFTPFVKVAAARIAGNSKPACDLFDGPLLHDYIHSIKMTLSPGRSLDEMNLRTGQVSVLEVKNLIDAGRETRVRLLEWARHAVVQASSCGIFGAEHPFRDMIVERAFWEWQIHLPTHMAGLDLLGRANKVRGTVHQSMMNYCSALPADVSSLVSERQQILRESGMGFEDAARQESNFCVAVFGNTAPTLFWAIYEIFSRPELLAEVREEIETNAVEGTEGEDVFRFTLDVAALKTKCPLLLSTYQEVQRSRDSHANIRTVLADTFLDEGRYLLRKGNYCLIPSASVHKSTSIWGESATTFDPYRFTARNTRNGEQRSDLKSGVPPPSSFLAWGNPPYLCPARQYAATEIFILLALLVMQVDLVPVGNKGQWERYPALNTGDLVSVFNPMKDIEVEVKPTKSARGKWMLNMGESKTRIALVSG